MKQRYFPVLTGASLLVSGSIITGLANADMDDASHKRDKFMAMNLSRLCDASSISALASPVMMLPDTRRLAPVRTGK